MNDDTFSISSSDRVGEKIADIEYNYQDPFDKVEVLASLASELLASSSAMLSQVPHTAQSIQDECYPSERLILTAPQLLSDN